MLSQSLINLVDAFLISPLGQDALAAVGAGSNINFVALSLVAGLSTAIQTLVARRVGAGQSCYCAMPVNHGLLIAAFFALPVSLLLMLSAPWMLKWFSSDNAILNDAVIYFQIRIMGLMAATLSLSFRGFWNGIGCPRLFLYILLFSHGCNILFSYLLIHGVFFIPPLGIAGAAIGTLISMYTGVILNFLLLLRKAVPYGFMQRRKAPAEFSRLLRLAIPDSIQQTSFALGIMVFFLIISQMGTKEMAITHILTNLSLILILPGIGLGMATTTLVSRSLGAKRPDEAWRWGKESLYLAVITLSLLSIPLFLRPDWFLLPFIRDPALLSMGVTPLRITGLGILLDTGSLVLTHALLGAGANQTVLCIRFICQWLFLLPACWMVSIPLNMGFTTIWVVHAIQRLISSIAFIIVWQKKHWC